MSKPSLFTLDVLLVGRGSAGIVGDADEATQTLIDIGAAGAAGITDALIRGALADRTVRALDQMIFFTAVEKGAAFLFIRIANLPDRAFLRFETSKGVGIRLSFLRRVGD